MSAKAYFNDLMRNYRGVATNPSAGGAVTPSDTDDLDIITTHLYVGVSGDLVVTMAGNGAKVTLKSAPVGLLPLRVSRVWNTDTTATNIIWLA